MIKKEYKQKSDVLLKKWHQGKYKDADDFSYDGISDFDIWSNQSLKVLYLLKETNSNFQPSICEQKINGSFGLNLARWDYAIKCIFKNPDTIPKFPDDDDLPKYFDKLGVAMVEVKKVAGGGNSNNIEIESFAFNDKKELKEQIELINPQFIVCCGTLTSYEIIYDWKPDKIDNNYFDDNNGNDCSFWIHDNRLVLYFYHPSLRGRGKEEVYSLLCKMLVEGKAFKRLKSAQ